MSKDSPNIRYYRVLRSARPLATLDQEVSVNVTNEILWDTTMVDERKQVRSIVVKGQLTELDKTYSVEWSWIVDGALKSALSLAVETIEDTSSDFSGVHTPPVEREMWVDVAEWLRLGLIFSGNVFSHAYVEFRKDGKKIRVRVENTAGIDQLNNLIQN